MKTLALLAAALLASSGASAQAWRSYVDRGGLMKVSASACPRLPTVVVGDTQGYADDLGTGECYVSLHSMSAGMVYRDYALFSGGMLMVFSSYGAGQGSDMTSAREFYFFPRTAGLALEMDPAAGTIAVRLTDGGRATFDPASSQISGLDRGEVTVSPRVDRAERGGVEIPRYDGLLLDAGFRLGELPSGLPDAESVFRNAQGQLCKVKNREIFSYRGRDHSLTFDDAGLSAFLKKRCPGLDVRF